MKTPEILVIDDEVAIQNMLRITLETSGFRCTAAFNSHDGLKLARINNPDLILLDLGLPDMYGQETLKVLRQWFVKPVLVISVTSDEGNIVSALDAGANDYLVKPFRTGELLARIRSALRGHAKDVATFHSDADVLEVDLTQRVVRKNGVPVKLTTTEFDLLSLLSRNEGRVLTHNYLLQHLWGPGYLTQTQYLRVFVAQLRKKIETDPNHPTFIFTESGVGYRFKSLSSEGHTT